MKLESKTTRNIFRTLIAGLLLISMGCEKLVEVDPPKNSLTSQNVFSDDKTAIATITALYARIASQLPNNLENLSSISAIAGLSADEFRILPTLTLNRQPHKLLFYYNNTLNAEVIPIWNDLYRSANEVTNIIEGLNAQAVTTENPSSMLTASVKQQLLGEAKFMRAFCYFYLVNLYGDVPLQLTTNVVENAKRPKAPKDEVYRQIVKDLLEAKSSLSANYLSGNLSTVDTERIRPNKSVASALLSRVYLYMGNWSSAETEATEVISKTEYTLVPLNDAFLKDSREAIFQLQPVALYRNTGFGRIFILTASGPASAAANLAKIFYLNEAQVNVFAAQDPRRINWISSVTNAGKTYYFPMKYKKGLATDGTVTSTGQITEYMMILRLGEQYLIRAEARARQDKLQDAISDVNTIRTRARSGAATTIVPNYPLTLNQQEILDAVSLERRLELFTEWGDRWLDLKRTGRVDAVMSLATPLKGGGSWSPHQALYPLFYTELRFNPNLVQNPGY